MFNFFKKQVSNQAEVKKNIPKVFIFIGRSGCGKGTQADLLMTHLCENEDKLCKTFHLETGAFLREFVKGDSYTQKLCRTAMEEGKLMPESVMVALWENYLVKNFTGNENLIFDGCPRKLHEAQLLDSALNFYQLQKPTVVYIHVSRDWSQKRLMARARKDDTEGAITRRLDWFDSEVIPTIEYYKANSYYNFVEVNGEQPIDEVQKEILSKLGLKS